MSEETLRALIRYIPPIVRLRKDLEMSVQLEQFTGLGDMAVKSYNGLQASVAQHSDDPYIDALSLELASDAGDREKVAQVALATGQLMAYIQGQLGLSLDLDGSSAHTHVNSAPNIEIQGLGSGESHAVMRVVKRVLSNDDVDIEIEEDINDI